jgi:hypothetical protein
MAKAAKGTANKAPIRAKPAPIASAPEGTPAPAPVPDPVPAHVPAHAPQPAASSAGKPDAFEDAIRIPLERWWAFACAGIVQFYLRLLKLNLVRVVSQYAAIALLAALIAAAAYAIIATPVDISLPAALIGVGTAGILSCLLVLWLIQSFENAAYLLTSSQISRSPFSIRDGLDRVKGKSLRFMLLDMSLRTLMLIPAVLVLLSPLLAAIVGGTGPTPALLPLFFLTYMFYVAYYYATGILYQFLTQFWRYGFLFEGLGIVASLRKSVSLLRSHFAEVLVYDLILVVLYFVATIPLMLFTAIAYFGMIFIQFAAMAMPLAGIAAYAVAFFIVALGATFLSTIAEAVWRPAHYEFWKRIAAHPERKAPKGGGQPAGQQGNS